jgi:Trypsin
LISTKLVITAAHCIQGKYDLARKAEDASFYLGKHDLESTNEQNFIVASVTEFIIHPDWKIYSDCYDADLAIAVLSQTVSFSELVRPICLWTLSSNANDLVGRTATVAGRGKTEAESFSRTPKYVEIPIVSDGTCLRSNAAFSSLTSERTFCAGDRDSIDGPCNGDSGKVD